jgi:hypothetical protein
MKIFILSTIVTCFVFLSAGCGIKDNYVERIGKADKAMEKMVKENNWSFEERKKEKNNPFYLDGVTTDNISTYWETQSPGEYFEYSSFRTEVDVAVHKVLSDKESLYDSYFLCKSEKNHKIIKLEKGEICCYGSYDSHGENRIIFSEAQLYTKDLAINVERKADKNNSLDVCDSAKYIKKFMEYYDK